MAAEQTPIQGNKVLITIAAMLGALMAVIDISIVNVALSDIRASFGTPLDQIAWVSTGYAMANVTIIPMSGWLQRRFGFRRYFAGSLLMFTAASALCGLAWNLPSLVVFRILQGIGGGAIIPTSQNILFARYPQKEHGMAGALFALGAVTGPLLGPTLGGKLIDVASWHWIFLINVPVGLARRLGVVHLHQGAGVQAGARADRRPGHRAARGGHGVAPVRARGGQPRRVVRGRADRGPRLCGGHLPRHLRGARAGDRAPGRGLPGVQEHQLHRRHRAQLPRRHRALRRVVPLLALLRNRPALRGDGHRSAVPSGQLRSRC